MIINFPISSDDSYRESIKRIEDRLESIGKRLYKIDALDLEARFRIGQILYQEGCKSIQKLQQEIDILKKQLATFQKETPTLRVGKNYYFIGKDTCKRNIRTIISFDKEKNIFHDSLGYAYTKEGVRLEFDRMLDLTTEHD